MKRVAIVGLGWLGMPLALALHARGWQVCGSKRTPDGVAAARMCGIDSYRLLLTPRLECEADDLEALLRVDALVVAVPASQSVTGDNYLLAIQQLIDSALACGVPHILFTSSISVYGDISGHVNERSVLRPTTLAGRTLAELENWLHDLPGTRVDILRLAGLVGPQRHPGRFLAGKRGLENGHHGVNLVHLDDVIAALTLLLERGNGGVWNICAPEHPARGNFYPEVTRQLGLTPPEFNQASGGQQGKVIDGSKICRQLGFRYQYPNPNNMPLS
ncbi:NAD(P)-dependent oxidoreductase [Erwinia sp. OLTSP20]|uniref:SDR family oxidoreductase n=1 Tax=unclassified Erwinia TaxID=2622719 RepID=UPI000C178E88|nr:MULTISPECIES: SDR family oxidoreductase [unclassified Erwinia]PIJ50857.1 NAD(P)-dependent oxidoreductase [Erwinia sp. OAMSP11]PIJ73243.1 NAD(P)-dependent oxidoreductase [Erwinia sp. OLSSP12]PIJ82257.1 NAD(P)-dependent oxidoreductase [Erwinia sp. OLCASP19]PIJ85409.1 NAD(P)-dependent oxidoreductase [Erwinia sp. OLMTSP26]PIJ87106.1 NAD(P)-dependent oxidoreductase [Erwinia sp. OLMDSP33]